MAVAEQAASWGPAGENYGKGNKGKGKGDAAKGTGKGKEGGGTGTSNSRQWQCPVQKCIDHNGGRSRKAYNGEDREV